MAYVLTCVIVLVAMMMVSVLFQYRYVYSVIDTQRDAAQTQLDSVVMKSAVENYDALKQGRNYPSLIDYTKLEQDAYAALGFSETDTEALEEDLYTVNRPQITTITEGGFGLTVKYELEVPFVVMGIHYGEITVPITLISKFTEK
jgi:hypothetical protein